MKAKKYNSISDIPADELKDMMVTYGKKKFRTVRSGRAFLRSIGVPIDNKGRIDESKLSGWFAY